MNEDELKDGVWMGLALEEARRATTVGEVPVGAIVVVEEQVIGRGHNQPLSTVDPTAHAEIVALRRAAKMQRNYRLVGTTLYTTLEPCLMCVGALFLSRVDRLVFGCSDPKAGACGSIYNVPADNMLNHKIVVSGGVRASESRSLLRDFFQIRRQV